MLLSFTSSEANSTHLWQADNNQSGQLFRPKLVELLQLCVSWATEVNHRSIAACPECCRETDLWFRSAWSRDVGCTYELHWLPVEQRVTFKLCTLMHLIRTGCSPSYMSELVTTTSRIASRSRLRSASIRRSNNLQLVLSIGRAELCVRRPCILELTSYTTPRNN